MLVTNQLQFTRHADTVVYMQDGRVEELGTYAQLMASGGGFAKLMAQNQARMYCRMCGQMLGIQELEG